MSLTLYAHPFAAYCWKVLIALYENGTPFRYRMVDDAAAFAELEAIWPLKKFPVLKDSEASVIESSVIIEYLMLRHPGPTRLLPDGIDAALKVRFMDRFFDQNARQAPSFRAGKESAGTPTDFASHFATSWGEVTLGGYSTVHRTAKDTALLAEQIACRHENVV
jgi:glutathione S-transferase